MSDIQQNFAMSALDMLQEQESRNLQVGVKIPDTDCKLMIQVVLVEEVQVDAVQKAFNALNEFNRQLIGRTRAERELKALKEEQFE